MTADVGPGQGEVSGGDRAALGDLVHRYAAAVDDGRPEVVARLFVEQGVLVVPADPRRVGETLVHQGREAVAAAVMQATGLHVTYHAIVGATFTPGRDHDEVIGRVACTAHHVRAPDEDDAAVDDVWYIVYRDRYVRIADGWRFARRELTLGFRERRSVKVPREG